MYKCVIDGNNIHLMSEDEILAELRYQKYEDEDVVVVEWLSISPDMNEKLGEENFINNYFSLLKNVGNTINKELNEQGKILWGSFPEVKELDNYAKNLDASKKEIKPKNMR